MARPEEVRDVSDGLGGEAGEAGVGDGQDLLAFERVGGDEITLDAAVRRGVLAVREHFLELEFGHRDISPQRRGDTKRALLRERNSPQRRRGAEASVFKQRASASLRLGG